MFLLSVFIYMFLSPTGSVKAGIRQGMILWPQVYNMQSMKVLICEENTKHWVATDQAPICGAPFECIECLTIISWQKWPGSFWLLIRTSKDFTRSQTKGENQFISDFVWRIFWCYRRVLENEDIPFWVKLIFFMPFVYETGGFNSACHLSIFRLFIYSFG